MDLFRAFQDPICKVTEGRKTGDFAMMRAGKTKKEDPPVEKHMKLGNWTIRLPRARWARIGMGSGLVLGGLLGFLPVLGFWMVPVGVVVLSKDVPAVRRFRRRAELWWMRRRRARNEARMAGRD